MPCRRSYGIRMSRIARLALSRIAVAVGSTAQHLLLLRIVSRSDAAIQCAWLLSWARGRLGIFALGHPAALVKLFVLACLVLLIQNKTGDGADIADCGDQRSDPLFLQSPGDIDLRNIGIL
jgi:hypothetical protein